MTRPQQRQLCHPETPTKERYSITVHIYLKQLIGSEHIATVTAKHSETSGRVCSYSSMCRVTCATVLSTQNTLPPDHGGPSEL